MFCVERHGTLCIDIVVLGTAVFTGGIFLLSATRMFHLVSTAMYHDDTGTALRQIDVVASRAPLGLNTDTQHTINVHNTQQPLVNGHGLLSPEGYPPPPSPLTHYYVPMYTFSPSPHALVPPHMHT